MDILADPMYKVLTKVAAVHAVPDYVAACHHITKEAAAALPDGEFGDDGARMYPLCDAAHTWLAASYLKEAQANTPVVIFQYTRDRIKQAASIYGNRSDVDAVFDRAEPETSPETDPSNWGWTETKVAADGRTLVERSFPMFDRFGVEKAASYFDTYRYQYPLEARRTIAGNIFRKAQQYGVDVGPSIEKAAGFGVPVRSMLVEEIDERVKLTKDAEAGQVLRNLGQHLATCPADDLFKSANAIEEVLDSVDELNGLRRHYGRRLISPADAVYAMSMKQASDLTDDSVTLNQHTFSLSKLASLDPEVFSVLGDDFVTEVKMASGGTDHDKLSAILPTLPRPDKILLERHLTTLYA